MSHFEALFRQPLPFRLIRVRQLDIVLERGVAHGTNFERSRIDHHHIVSEPSMHVEQQVSLDVQNTLKKYPFLQLHPPLIHNSVEINASPRLQHGQTIQTVQHTVTCQYDSLIAGTSVVVEHGVDSVGERLLRRSGGVHCNHV